MILGIVKLGLYVIGRWDRPLVIGWKSRLWILAGAVAELMCITELTCCRPSWKGILWMVLGGCFLLACITDSLICQVYNFTWWIALAAALPLWCGGKGPGIEIVTWMQAQGGLFLFAGLQLFLGGRIYGRADCYAFCVCAVAGAAVGMSLAGFLTQMLIAYTLLFIVQAACRNVDKRGNLRKPAPFLPYITAAFWMSLLLFAICSECKNFF